tara:strand:+ start:1182 stop:1520 length:339 start_codon:yes stop_codon:yes gene_type:complete
MTDEPGDYDSFGGIWLSTYVRHRDEKKKNPNKQTGLEKEFEELSESFTILGRARESDPVSTHGTRGRKEQRKLCAICSKDISKYVLNIYDFDIMGTTLCNQCRNNHMLPPDE